MSVLLRPEWVSYPELTWDSGGSWPRYCTARSIAPFVPSDDSRRCPRFCYLLVVQDGACWTRPEVCGGVPLPLGCAGVEGAHPPAHLPHFACPLIFCAFFCLRISFSLAWWQWLWLAGWCGVDEPLPCVPMSGDIIIIRVYSGILQVNRLG